jgi:hypothetical protein
MPDKDNNNQESAEEYNKQVMKDNLEAGRRGGYLKMLKVESSKGSGPSLIQKAADTALQKGLDNFKLALLPFSWLVFPLIIIFLTINAELVLPIIRPSWKLSLWRKVLYIIIDFLVLFILFIIIGLFITIKDQPEVICEALGGQWLNLVCSVANDIFSPFK